MMMRSPRLLRRVVSFLQLRLLILRLLPLAIPLELIRLLLPILPRRHRPLLLAMALILWATATQPRLPVVRMGRQHLRPLPLRRRPIRHRMHRLHRALTTSSRGWPTC